MGSLDGQWIGALDERVKVGVDICCLTDYHTLLAEKGLAGTASTTTCRAC